MVLNSIHPVCFNPIGDDTDIGDVRGSGGRLLRNDNRLQRSDNRLQRSDNRLQRSDNRLQRSDNGLMRSNSRQLWSKDRLLTSEGRLSRSDGNVLVDGLKYLDRRGLFDRRLYLSGDGGWLGRIFCNVNFLNWRRLCGDCCVCRGHTRLHRACVLDLLGGN
jgi:hypothetical protein